jgi:hypothetical protein
MQDHKHYISQNHFGFEFATTFLSVEPRGMEHRRLATFSVRSMHKTPRLAIPILGSLSQYKHIQPMLNLGYKL